MEVVESLRTSQLMVDFVSFRAPHERKKENKKQEDLPEGQPLPDGQMLQKGQGAQISKDKAKDKGGDKATKEGPSLGKTEPQRDAKGKASPGLGTDPMPVHLQAPFGFIQWCPGAGASHAGAELPG